MRLANSLQTVGWEEGRDHPILESHQDIESIDVAS